MAPDRLVWIGLGANLGDAEASLREAARRLAEPGHLADVRVSSLYQSAPWGKSDQPWFTNAVLEGRTARPPLELLRELLALEQRMGRERHERWGPRTIDLDYLLDESERSESDELRLPHPYLEERAFVLAPLAELRPELVLPSGTPIAERLAALAPDQPLRRLGTIGAP